MALEIYAPEIPYPQVAIKVALSAGIGLLVGLEREWAQKEIGVRTFAISGLLGALTSLLSPVYVVAALVGVLLLVTFLNIHSLLKDRSLELTTSMCLLVVYFLGVLVGQGHHFTAGTSAIVMMSLLAWKPELERFAGALRPEEIRSAVLLGLLGVVIYPLLPNNFVDPWQLVNPQEYWVTVLVIAGIGFVNYALLRLYGSKGLYYSAALGGLVNSTAAAAELAALAGRSESPALGTGVLLLTNVAMFLRNFVLLAIFARVAVKIPVDSAGDLPKYASIVARTAIKTAAPPLLVMGALSILLVWLSRDRDHKPSVPLQLSSPVSLKRVTKFGLLFLFLACAGTLAQRQFGKVGFLLVSALGGLVSSASTTATAAGLITTNHIDARTGGIATVLTSMTSALATLPVVYQQARNRALTRRLAIWTALIVCAGAFVMLFV